MKSGRRCKLVTGSVLIVLGVLSLTVALLCQLLIPTLVRSEVKKSVIVDSTDHPLLSDFVSNVNGAPKYNYLWFYNVSQEDQLAFIGGQRSIQPQLCGPYVFKETYQRNDVQFQQDGAVVQFSEAVKNDFVSELSNGSLEDVINIINVPFIKAMTTFGSVSRLLKLAALTVMPTALKEMEAAMAKGVKAGVAAQLIKTMLPAVSLPFGGRQKFLRRFSGYCSSQKCANIFTPAGCLFNPPKRSGILVDQIPDLTMAKLLDVSYNLSVLNEYGMNLWISLDGKDYSKGLIQAFNLTNPQFQYFKEWFIGVNECKIVKSVAFYKINSGKQPMHKVRTWSDLPYRQWLKGDVLSSLQDSKNLTSVAPEQPPELSFASLNYDAQFAISKWNLTTVKCLAEVISSNKTWAAETFMDVKPRPGKREDYNRASMDDRKSIYDPSTCFIDQAEDVKAFVEYLQYAGKMFVQPEFQRAIKKGSGLFTKRTVLEHALGFEEPFLKMVLDPSDPSAIKHGWLANDQIDQVPLRCTSSADLDNDFYSCLQVKNGSQKYYVKPPRSVYTGKDHINRIGQYKTFNGQQQLNGIFPDEPMDFETTFRSSAGESFPPDYEINSQEHVTLFIPALTALARLRSTSDIELLGIKMRRFVLEGFGHNVDQPFVQTVDLYEPKVVNAIAHVPIGTNLQDSWGTFIDIEPITGKTMRAQITVNVTTSTSGDAFDAIYPNVFRSDNLPVLAMQIRSEVTEPLADDFKSQVYSIQKLAFIGFICGLVCGITFLALGVWAVVTAGPKKIMLV